MLSRRHLLIAGGLGLVASSAASRGRSAMRYPRAQRGSPSLLLYDEALPGAYGVARLAGEHGIAFAAFSDDVGVPWLDLIEPSWRRQPQAIAGITRHGACFCMEMLGQDHGLACTYRAEFPAPTGEATRSAAAALLRTAARGARTLPASPTDEHSAAVAWLLRPTAGRTA